MSSTEHPLVGAMQLRGLTAAELARRSGLTEAAISFLIARKRRPTADTVAKLSRALGMTDLADQLEPWIR